MSLSITLFNALSGVTYMILIPACLPPFIKNLCITGKAAASVLPVAVADMSNTSFPSSIRGISLRWGSVGSSKPLSCISLLTGRQSRENAFFSDKARGTFFAA